MKNHFLVWKFNESLFCVWKLLTAEVTLRCVTKEDPPLSCKQPWYERTFGDRSTFFLFLFSVKHPVIFNCPTIWTYWTKNINKIKFLINNKFAFSFPSAQGENWLFTLYYKYWEKLLSSLIKKSISLNKLIVPSNGVVKFTPFILYSVWSGTFKSPENNAANIFHEVWKRQFSPRV